MRTRWLVGLLVALALPAQAAQFWTYESITVADSAVGIADATLNPGPGQVTACEARLETAQIRYRLDAAPTASEGVLLEVGDVLAIASHADAEAIQFIRTGATSGTLKVQCWRQ